MDRTQQAVAVFDKRALHYQSKYMDQSLYEDTFDLFCEGLLKRKPNLLEVACGPGNVTRCLLQKRPDFNMLCTDLAPNMIELARGNNPGAAFRVMDCGDIDQAGRPFDGIVAGFCFPYLSKEEVSDFIAKAARMLEPGGLLYISTMEGNYADSGWQTGSAGDRIYVYYHEAAYIREYLEKEGFKVLHFIRKDFIQPGGAAIQDVIIIAQK